jgi:hypothetical protein
MSFSSRLAGALADLPVSFGTGATGDGGDMLKHTYISHDMLQLPPKH